MKMRKVQFMMNEKRLPYVIMAISLVFSIVLGACASIPQGPYYISTKPVEGGTLQGKKTVIFNIETVERGVASRQDSGKGGGLSGLIKIGTGIASVVSYNNSGKKFDEANAADLKETFKVFDALIASTWQRAYNAETVQAAYNFGSSTPKLDFFTKPKEAIKREIANVCAQNNAEFAVTIMQQITHGYLIEGVMGIGNTAITHISAQICVYDKNGDVMISALAKLPNVSAGMDYGYKLTANNAKDYEQLYFDSLKNILTTIMAFDSSAASFAVEDLMEDVSIRLSTTEDVD
jgi:hypothetical protein